MSFPSLPSVRASAALVLALTLTGCFSSHPCAVTTDETVVEGHLDYAFNDGTQTSVALAPGDDPPADASATNGNVFVTWNGPLSATTGAQPQIFLSMKLPDADGSFDLGTLSARTCACQNGFVQLSGEQVSCFVGGIGVTSSAECQSVPGGLEVRRLSLGDCAAKKGCRDTTVVEVLLTSPAEKGLSGNLSFTHTTSSIMRSCPEFDIPIG